MDQRDLETHFKFKVIQTFTLKLNNVHEIISTSEL